jgi:putative salt-induced outer membrane protein YdiY
LQIRTVLLSLYACSLLSAADQVVLKNGDTITGTVIKKDGDKLTLKSEFLGEVTMPWSAVKSLKSDQELNVVLPGGETVKGKLTTTGDNLSVAAPSGEKTAALTAVGAVRNDAEQHNWERVQHPGILDLWTGSYNFGLALARGNARAATLTNAIIATRTTTKDKIILHFNEIYATALVNNVNSATASSLSGGWEYNRNLNPRLFVATTNEYDHDRFQSLDLRAVFGGGLGWNAIKTPKASLSFQAGGDYNRETYMAGIDRNTAEVNFGDDLAYKFSGATSLTQSFRMFPNLSDTGQYRMNFNLSAVTSIRKWLGWHVSFTDTFQSDPVLGRLRNDVILSTGFQLAFASK